MKKIFLLTLAIVVAWTAAMAVPAKPGLNTVTMSDGTTLQVQVLGDEWNHSLATADGLTIAFGDDGLFYYVVSGNISNVRAHDVANRSAAELSFVNANKDQMTMAAIQEAKYQSGKLRSVQPRNVSLKASQVPNNGSPRVPIILVQYTDKSMKHTKTQFEAQYNTNAKSVFNYFKDQSNSLYTPQFDIYGIYTLPSSRATYGANNSSGDDVGVAKMVGDAITKAGNDINWSQYDNDGDGQADVCIVVYAGVGEAQASYTVPNAIWPCQWSLSAGAYYGDGPGAITRNGVTIDKFAVFNEISGSSDSGSTMDGIGTFCHEFSHCLGLPDFYETTYNHGYFGMSYWSLMDTGCYNGGSISGDTPIGYSAYEKNFMGWINYITPTENTFYTLPVFNSKTAENDKAVRITALNNNEYWILENRKKQGWDYYIQDEGILITHFTYVADRWSANTVNNNSVQLATIMPADNSLSTNNLDKDLYGETNHAFGPNTSPAMKANMSASGSLSNSTGGAGTVNKPVTEINLNSDGTASFWYIKGEVQNPTINVSTSSLAFEGYVGDTYTKTFTVTGVNLTGNITITKQGSNVYTVSPTSITAANAASGVQVTVTYKPTAAGNTNATLTLASTGAQNVTVNLTGTAQAKTPTITVNPASLSFAATLGNTVTKTINLSGQFLSNNVTVTLNDNNGVFSVTPTTITAANANNGTQVTVSFSSANEGNFTGSLTFASNGAESKTVQLTASAAEGGNATDPYLNIAKYNTIGQAGATVSGMSKIYSYTEYPSNACAWLTLSYYGAQKVDANQNWFDFEGTAKSASENWNATGIFLGSSNYFTSTAYYCNWNEAWQNFYVTNCSEVSQLSYNIQSSNYSGNVYPVKMQIYECTLNADGTLSVGTTAVVDKQSQTTNQAEVLSSGALDPSKIYKVRIYNDYSRLYEIGFKTNLDVTLPATPINVEADPSTTTAGISWTPGENNDGWNLRWRVYDPDATGDGEVTFFESFEDGLDNWTLIDSDGDGNNWRQFNPNNFSSGGFDAYDGDYTAMSRSWQSDPLTPDQWMISPLINNLGGTLKYYIVDDGSDYQENYRIYVSTAGKNISDFVPVTDDMLSPNSTEWTEVNIDLSSYSGQAGYIAFRHYNCTDQDFMLIDAVSLTGKPAAEWNYVNNVTCPYTITGLTPETTYEVQVQGVNDITTSAWTTSTLFTTLGGTTLAEIERSGVLGTYTISDELVAVYADVDAGLLWCKDQGNASINPSMILDGQIDFMRDAALTGNTGQGDREWDQSNWIVLKFPEADNVNGIESLLENIKGKKIAAGTVIGQYIDKENYTIEVQPVDGKYTLTFSGTTEYAPNVYCAANFLESNLNIGGYTGAVGVHGDRYFFMNPKIQEICEITYAMWDGEKFVTPDNTEISGAFNVDWSRNCPGTIGGKPSLQEGQTYRFVAIVSHPSSSKLNILKGGGTPSGNFMVYPANLEGDGNIVTGINGVFTDGNRGEVVGVEYVNSLGVVSKKPFQGMNIVVTRYSDGTTSSVKKVFK